MTKVITLHFVVNPKGKSQKRLQTQHFDCLHLSFTAKLNIPTFVTLDMTNLSVAWLIKNEKCSNKSNIDQIGFAV